MSEECYACMVGVWTGPESHSEGCPQATAQRARVEHVVRAEMISDIRWRWECSCGHSGSTEGDPDLASDRHINYEAGDRRMNSSASLDAPWVR